MTLAQLRQPLPRRWVPIWQRMALWGFLCVLAALQVYPDSLGHIGSAIASPLRVVDERMVHAWGVLALCLVGIALKRREIARDLALGPNLTFAAAGTLCVASSLALVSPADLLAGWLGLFMVILGPAARWPAFMFGVYLGSLALPVLATTGLGDAALGTATIIPTVAALQLMGFPVQRFDQLLLMPTSSGESIRVLITAACAGPATLGVFLAIFGTMTADLLPPVKVTILLFLIGLLGTWVENVGRVVFLLLIGHYHGEKALWDAHHDSGYALFIGWYMMFAAFYLYVVRRKRRLAASRAATAEP